MKSAETLLLEIRVLDDGLAQVRRKDRKPPSAADLEEARRVADSLPGNTVADVLKVWPGAKVIRQ
jgi:hypothetical protein